MGRRRSRLLEALALSPRPRGRGEKSPPPPSSRWMAPPFPPPPPPAGPGPSDTPVTNLQYSPEIRRIDDHNWRFLFAWLDRDEQFEVCRCCGAGDDEHPEDLLCPGADTPPTQAPLRGH